MQHVAHVAVVLGGGGEGEEEEERVQNYRGRT
jgi:hypothetical protein